MTGRICPTLREAIHSTATTYREGMKRLAGELDMSPSELSMRTTLGGDSARPFDSSLLVPLMQVTQDFSPLLTLCSLLGFEPPQPKRDRFPEMLTKAATAFEELSQQMKQLNLFAAEYLRDEKRRAGR